MSHQLESKFGAHVSQIVIESDNNDGRFEVFCLDVVSHIEGGAKILSTSTSWDRGRDGVGIGAARGIYVCTSLRDDVDAKALTDIARITETTTRIDRLYFCSSQRLTEHRKDQIEKALNHEVDFKFPIVCLGSIQLAEIGRDEKKSLQRNYGSEIRDCIRTISIDANDESELQGLRLALITSGSDDTHAIRQSVYTNGLLEVFSDGQARTLSICSRDLAGSLKLGRNLSPETIQPFVESLHADGHLDRRSAQYVISMTGLQKVEEIRTQAADRLLKGRVSIQAALERAIGTPIATDDFSRIWAVFEEKIAHYFQSRGQAIVAEISDLLDEQHSSSKQPAASPLSFIDELADSVSSTSSHHQRREELKQAIKDLFSDRSGEAAQWLVRVCASFVAACALGLEHSSSLALGKLFARTSIILDTDVVLSLLGEGEPEHESAQAIVRRWTENGGKVLVAEPVLDEVAYHAWIAQQDFDQVSHFLPGTEMDRLHVIDNAFVRSFAELMNRKEAGLQQWRKYIGMYKGKSPHDWGSVFGLVSTEYSIRKLPARSTKEADLADKVRLFLLGIAEKT